MIQYLFAFVFLPLDSAIGIYVTLFAVLILSGIGLPIPEEATLIFGGYLAYLEFIEFKYALYALVVGIVAADMFGYCLGRFGGEKMYKLLSRMRIPLSFVDRIKNYFDRYGSAVVLFSRPLIGVRVAVPILAGHFRMNFLKFLFFDIVGAIPWTILLVSISYYFGLGLDLITDIKEIKHAIFMGVAIAIFLAAGFKLLWKKNKEGGD